MRKEKREMSNEQCRPRNNIKNFAAAVFALAVPFIILSCSIGGDVGAWREKTDRTVTFNSNGGSAVPAQTVGHGGTATRSADPSRGGHTFDGWYVNSGLTGAYDFSTAVTSDITLHAKWTGIYTVTFNGNGGSGVDPQTVISGGRAARPDPDPERSGYKFGGWYGNSGLTAVYDFNRPVTGNITIYAKWDKTCTVTFDANGGTGMPPAPVEELPGARITVPGDGGLYKIENPRIWIPDGWNANRAGTGANYAPGSAFTVPGNDVTLYVKWKEVTEYIVVFNGNGGSPVPTQTVTAGGTAARPANPVRTGYTFVDWYSNEGLTSAYNFSTPVTGNIISLYAKWTPNTYTITYRDVGGGAFSGTHGPGYPVTHTYGTATTLVSPSKVNYVFGGWFANSAGTGSAPASLSATGYTANITLYAKWFEFYETVRINAGTFMMGSPATEPGREEASGRNETRHQVTLTQGFYMGKYPVTQTQYQAVMGTNPSWFTTANGRPPAAGETDGKRPVETVNWYDALVFCNRLSVREGLSPAYRINNSTDSAAWGSVPAIYDWHEVPAIDSTAWDAVTIVSGSTGYRLPTEAQWEYACRAGTTTAYNTGATVSNNTGWYSVNGNDRTHEVGLKPANAWGLYDMPGNVSEWCWDRYGDYPSGAQTDPAGASSGSYRSVRGGYFGNTASCLRSAYRNSDPPSYRVQYIGFRVVRP